MHEGEALAAWKEYARRQVLRLGGSEAFEAVNRRLGHHLVERGDVRGDVIVQEGTAGWRAAIERWLGPELAADRRLLVGSGLIAISVKEDDRDHLRALLRRAEARYVARINIAGTSVQVEEILELLAAHELPWLRAASIFVSDGGTGWERAMRALACSHVTVRATRFGDLALDAELDVSMVALRALSLARARALILHFDERWDGDRARWRDVQIDAPACQVITMTESMVALDPCALLESSFRGDALEAIGIETLATEAEAACLVRFARRFPRLRGIWVGTSRCGDGWVTTARDLRVLIQETTEADA